MLLLLNAMLLLTSTTSAASPPAGFANMNGEYLMAKTPNQPEDYDWNTNFSAYPGGVEYFEVHVGPVKSTCVVFPTLAAQLVVSSRLLNVLTHTHTPSSSLLLPSYSEVFWTALDAVMIPQDVQDRFKDGAIAVVGFEADQVRRIDMNDSSKDVSLPINLAYNHHYGARFLGAGSRMGLEKIPDYDPTDTSRVVHHPSPIEGFREVPVEHTADANGLPTSMVFGYSNGGEYRKTYHGVAPPFAQIVASPQQIHLTPMQIDTWNRDEMNLTGGKFVAGPAPRNSYAPTTGVDAIYSGLLECPLTTRIRKHIQHGGWNDSVVPQIYACAKPKEGGGLQGGPAPAPQTKCASGSEIANETACFAAAKTMAGLAGLTVSTWSGASATLPAGCTINTDAEKNMATLSWNTDAKSDVCCGASVSSTRGTTLPTSEAASIGVSLTVDLAPDASSKAPGKEGGVATITISGPSTVWFGIGFDVNSMANSPYAIIVDGTKGTVTERVLGQETPGVEINASVSVVSTSVKNGVRTVVVTRGIVGVSTSHHTFVATKLTFPFIAAVGSSPVFAYHAKKMADILTLWPSSSSSSNGNGAPACVCSLKALPFGHGEGTVEYMPTGGE